MTAKNSFAEKNKWNGIRIKLREFWHNKFYKVEKIFF